MTTQTAERQELHRVIDILPDESVVAVLDFVKGLQLQAEIAEQVDTITNENLRSHTMTSHEKIMRIALERVDDLREIGKEPEFELRYHQIRGIQIFIYEGEKIYSVLEPDGDE